MNKMFEATSYWTHDEYTEGMRTLYFANLVWLYLLSQFPLVREGISRDILMKLHKYPLFEFLIAGNLSTMPHQNLLIIRKDTGGTLKQLEMLHVPQ